MEKCQPLYQLVLTKLDSYMQEYYCLDYRQQLDYCITPYTKVNLKWIKDMNTSYEIIKFLEDNIGKNLLNINMSNIFLNASPWARDTNAKMKKWDYIKLKSFCAAKDTINRTKRHPTVWDNRFLNDISDKGLTSKYIKKSHASTTKNQITQLKNGQRI